MSRLNRIRIDYRYKNWGKTERIVCEQDAEDDYSFVLLKQGQNVGTIRKSGRIWKSTNNNIFLAADIAKIGELIDDHMQQNQSKILSPR